MKQSAFEKSSGRRLVGVAFALSAVLAALGISACDSGSSSSSSGPPITGTARPAMAVFAQYCNQCHPGGDAGEGPSLKTTRFGADQIKARVRNGFSRMPAFTTSQISDAELDALVAYIQSIHQ